MAFLLAGLVLGLQQYMIGQELVNRAVRKRRATAVGRGMFRSSFAALKPVLR